jgi:hypothetical protein
MADEENRDSKTADDEGGSDNAKSEKDDSSDDSPEEAASAGDKGSGGDDESKGGRAGERISGLIEKNKKLEESNSDLATRMEALETALATGGSKETKKEAASDDNPAIAKLKKLGYSDDQIEAAKLVYQSVAGSTDSELKKELGDLKAELAAGKEKEALNDAIIQAKKNGIEVTSKQIADFRRECQKSSDPREQLLAEAPYPRIIKLMKAEGILDSKEDAGNEEEQEEKPKRKSEPKIPGGKDSRQEKKPAEKSFKYDPGNAMGSMDAIERRVLAKIGADNDE